MKNIMGIYEIRNIQNNKVYIGSSKDINKRWKQHKYLLKNNKHHSPYFQNAWNKYGGDNFEFKIIEFVENADDLLDVEQKWLDSTRCYEVDNGYNVSENSRQVVYEGILPDVEHKKDIAIYVSTNDEKYLTKVQDGDYEYVKRDKFIYDLYKYYEDNINQREYISECRLYSKGVYLSMKDLVGVSPDEVRIISKSLDIDVISFDNDMFSISTDFYISKIIDYKYKILKRKDVLIVYTTDKKYEFLLSGED